MSSVACRSGPGRLRVRLRHVRIPWQRLRADGRLLLHQPLGLLGLVVIVGFGLMAVAHPLLMATVWNRARFDPIVGFDPTQVPHPKPPTRQHLLGTDNFGRDVLSQLLAGARVSFGVGLIAALVAVTISTLLGGAAGYFGGLADVALMGVADVFVLLPAPVVLLIFGLLLRMQWPVVALAYGLLTGLGGQAVVVKSQTLTIKARPFIEAARIAGGGDGHIIRVHILPGLMPLTVVHAVFTVVGAVLTESLLSFFSRTSYYLSWGTMIWLGQETFRWFNLGGQWHVILPPALAIMLFCSAFYLVGRALDEVLNPRLRRQ
ncbi:MAG TPA: ABC transporter permease [Anaerolineales bacterium]|nr:ABC transporter permease [Anaerolineales bacterium]